MNKDAARRWVWDELTRTGQAGFPMPVHGRIPNFVGAPRAAALLRTLPEWQGARVVKVNPDAPQHPVRLGAILDGKVLYMPTPRLRAGFICLRPEWIPPGKERYATSIKGMGEYGREAPLDQLEQVDLVVAGSVAVTADGRRAGKGEGYSDREYAILRDLGHPPMPVITTVHDLQVVPDLVRDPFDISLDIICTPTRVIRTHRPWPQPEGIDWSRVTEAELDEMPVLREMNQRRG